MKKKRHLFFFCSGTVVSMALACSFALAQGHGNGHGNGHGKGNNKHGDDDASKSYAFNDHDRDAVRDWYRDHRSSLPPGLAKKDRLPPGLERQLAERGTLPPGLQKRIQPVPVELDRQLPPPPPDCVHAVIGGHIVLLNRRSNLILADFQIDIQ